MNVELLKRRALAPTTEAEKGRASDWLFVGIIILTLVTISIASAALSVFLLIKLWQLLSLG